MLRILDRLEELIIASLIAAATIIVFIAVLHRYGTGLSIDLSKAAAARGMTWLAEPLKSAFLWLSSWDLSWAQELCIYMFIWMAKFGAAYGVRTGIHVGVDVLVDRIGSGNRYRLILFGLFAGALFTGVVGWLGANFVYDIYHTGQHSNDLEAPMWIVYLAVPLGSWLMCFRFLQAAYGFARTGVLPHYDDAHVEGLDDIQPGEARP
jgi:C4-dicarboxylate transporter, DctM subunit